MKELFNNKRAFMAHTYFGDPDRNFSLELIKTMIDAGIDILELGIPFSDPMIDGPTFQKACIRALKQKVTPKEVLDSIANIREYKEDATIVVTTYYNVIVQYGIKEFVSTLNENNVEGIIVPDIIYEEAEELIEECKKQGIHFIYIISPYATQNRIEYLVGKASGFVYLMRSPNVTGANIEKDTTKDMIQRIKTVKNIPVLVGFGISSQKTAKTIVDHGADGVIVGSAIAKIYENYLKEDTITNEQQCLDEISDFVKSIKEVVR